MIKEGEGVPEKEKDMFKGKAPRTSMESSEQCTYFGMI